MAQRVDPQLADQLEMATVRVLGPSGFRGSGFFIAPSIVATCAHVANTDNVVILDSSGRSHAGHKLHREPDSHQGSSWPLPDLALIGLADWRNEDYLALAAPDRDWADGLVACGFTLAGQGDVSLTYETPQLIGLEPVDGGRVPKLASCTFSPGMSGGPIVEANGGQVVGIIKRTRAKAVEAGGWAIPVGLLDAHFPEALTPIRTTQEEALTKVYLRGLIGETSTIEPRGMRRTSESQDVVIPLDDVYVSLELQDYASADLTGEDPDEDLDLASLADQPYLALELMKPRNTGETHTSEDISMESLFEAEARVMLLGDPGSGKSTLLQWLALTYARASLIGARIVEVAQSHIDPGSDSQDLIVLGPSRMPALLRAAHYDEAIRSARNISTMTDLLRLAVESIPKACANKAQVDDLVQLLGEQWEQGNLLLLVDGLDEITSLARRTEFRNLIRRLTAHAAGDSEHPSPPGSTKPPRTSSESVVVVTSRHAGYSLAPLPGRFRHAVLRPLADVAVLRFLTQWSYAVRRWADRSLDPDMSAIQRHSADRAASIQTALGTGSGLATLARTPLMLTVVSLVYEELGRLPSRRVALLQEMSRLLVERRSPNQYSDALDLLGPFAMWLHANRASGLATKDEFRRVVSQYIERVALEGPARRTSLVDEFCVSAQEQFGIIIERGAGLVGFQHRLFQEFFAAVEAVNSERGPYETLRPHLFDPVWREVVILCAGLEAASSRGAGSRFLIRVIRTPDEAGFGGVSNRPLFLVADCLLEIERSLPEVAIAVLKGIVSIASRQGTSGAAVRRAATERLLALASRYSGALDSVLAELYTRAQALGRYVISKLAVNLRLKSPALAAALRLRSIHSDLTLAEQGALLAAEQTNAPPPKLQAPAGAAVFTEMLSQVTRYHDDTIIQLLHDYHNGGGREYTAYLLELCGTVSGVHATVAGLAAIAYDRAIASAVIARFLTKSEMTRAVDCLVECCTALRVSVTSLADLWERFPADERQYMLDIFGAERVSAAAPLAWEELRLATGTSSPPPRGAESRVVSSLIVLNVGVPARLSDDDVRCLVQISEMSDNTANLVENLLAASSSRTPTAALERAEGGPTAASFWHAVNVAPEMEIDWELFETLLASAVHGNGLWRGRALAALWRPRPESQVAPRVLTAAASWFTSAEGMLIESRLPLYGVVQNFARRVLFASWPSLRVLLEDASLEEPSMFDNVTHEVEGQIWTYVSADARQSHGRAQAAQLLLTRLRDRGAVAPLDWPAAALVQDELPEVARLAGAVIAQRITSSGDPSVLRDSFARPISLPALTEICAWLAGSTDEQSRTVLLEELVMQRPQFNDTDLLPCLLRAGLIPDRATLQDALAISGASLAELVAALVEAGTDTVSSHAGVSSPPWLTFMKITELTEELGRDGDFLLALVAQAVALLPGRSDGDSDELIGDEWPVVRFCLEALVRSAKNSPDGFARAAASYGLLDRLPALLSTKLSYGVRLRAFKLMCYLRVLTKDMVVALSHFMFDHDVLFGEAMSELRLIAFADADAMAAFETLLESGGRGTVLAVDIARQLSWSSIFLREDAFRAKLWRLLLLTEASTSPFAECRVPSGVVLNVRNIVAEAQYQVGSAAGQSADSQWISLFRPQDDGLVRPSVAPTSGTFKDLFLSRLHAYLTEREGETRDAN